MFASFGMTSTHEGYIPMFPSRFSMLFNTHIFKSVVYPKPNNKYVLNPIVHKTRVNTWHENEAIGSNVDKRYKVYSV